MQHENQSLQALAYNLDLNILVQIWSRLSQKSSPAWSEELISP